MQCGRNVSRGGQALESHMDALLSLNNSIRVQWGENLMRLTKRKTTGPQLCMQLELISAMRFKKKKKKNDCTGSWFVCLRELYSIKAKGI